LPLPHPCRGTRDKLAAGLAADWLQRLAFCVGDEELTETFGEYYTYDAWRPPKHMSQYKVGSTGWAVQGGQYMVGSTGGIARAAGALLLRWPSVSLQADCPPCLPGAGAGGEAEPGGQRDPSAVCGCVGVWVGGRAGG
jgi:hypothetical protein